MAIDTAAKRKSCIGLTLIFARTGVIPDGSSLAAAQRLHVQALYAGIAATEPSAVYTRRLVAARARIDTTPRPGNARIDTTPRSGRARIDTTPRPGSAS